MRRPLVPSLFLPGLLWGLFCGLLAGLLPASSAAAQRSSFENVFFGERATAMGGAAIGLADEPSATYYNPAGLAQLVQDAVGVSVQVYGGGTIEGRGLLRAGDASDSFSSGSFSALPSSAGYAIPLGGEGGVYHAVGLSIVSPMIEELSFTERVRTADRRVDLSLISTLKEQSLLAGPSYALRIGDLHLGATIYLQYAELAFESVITADALTADGALRSIARTRQTSGSHIGFTGVVGGLLRFTREWSLGLRVRLPNGGVETPASHAVIETDITERGAEASVDRLRHIGVPGNLEYAHPWGLALGLGFRSRRLRFAADFRSYLPMDRYALFGGAIQPPSSPTDPLPSATREWDPRVWVPASRFVLNVAVGLEFWAADDLSVLFGVHTDASAIPPSVGLEYGAATTLSYVGVTAGLRQRSDAGAFTVSVGVRYGNGTVNAVAWDDGLTRGAPGETEQVTGMLAISWTRALSGGWTETVQELFNASEANDLER